MAITNGYCTLAELKAWLDITDTADDTQLEKVIEAASRWIDRQAGRRFFSTSDFRTRYYTADNPHYLYIDDVIVAGSSVTPVGGGDIIYSETPQINKLETDDNADGTHETEWTSSDYIPMPVNRGDALVSEVLSPVTSLEVNRNTGDYLFPVGVQNGVKVTAKFGYSASAPSDIKQACLMLSARLWKRKDSIFGIAGVADLGVQAVQVQFKKDPDIMALITPFRKVVYG